MTGSNTRRGFTLLIAVVLSAIAAAITLALTTLAYKGLILSSAAKESQFAFYAADAALECALYNDSGQAPGGIRFPYGSSGSVTVSCAGQQLTLTGTHNGGANETRYVPTSPNGGWMSIAGTRCARFSVYKTPASVRVYAEGTNVACSNLNNPRGIVRAIRAIY